MCLIWNPARKVCPLRVALYLRISARRAFLERVEIHLNRSQEKARQFKPIDSIGWIMAKDRYLPFPHEIMMISCYMGFG